MSLDVDKVRDAAIGMLNSGAPDDRCVTHLAISLEQALAEIVRLRAGIVSTRDMLAEMGIGQHASDALTGLLPKETP